MIYSIPHLNQDVAKTNESDEEGEEGLEQFSGFPGQLVSYPLGSDTFREFCKAKAVVGGKWGKCIEFAGQTWNDNIIWVKGYCLQRYDEELLDLRFRSVKQSVKSTVERKESLLNDIVEEETKLKLILKELGLSRKKRVDSSSAQPTVIKPSKVAQLFPKKRMLKTQPASGTTGSGEVVKEKRKRVKPFGESGEKVVWGQSASVDDLKEAEERARLAILQGEEDTSQMVALLIKEMWLSIEEEKSKLEKAKNELKDLARAKTGTLKEGYSEEEVDAIKADTYIEVEDEEVEVVGVVDGLDGVSCRIIFDNQEYDVELPKGGSEKVVRKMSLRINDLESGLASERKTSKALLSVQVELQVELNLFHAHENNVLTHNQEFAMQFDKIKEANEKREDQYVKMHFRLLKMHFRLVKLNQAVSDLTLQVEEKYYEIMKGLEDLSEATERTRTLQRQNELERMRQKFVEMDDELRVAREIYRLRRPQLNICKKTLPAKDMEFWEMQRRYDDLNERVAWLKAEKDQAITRAKKAEARERSGGSRTEVKAPLVLGDLVSLSSRIRELENDVSRS
ncbi:hypothetical protein GIB67_037451 [Kingdonia uniflora]|uniref:Uncharacterized protein n=1 Tax=Kingdonia uniflora TaxID=39325 RepID=A0A7J7NJ62_9MAGN|nr:hypothetical protein GIB67_037451 [Kingdonia uniflora]